MQKKTQHNLSWLTYLGMVLLMVSTLNIACIKRNSDPENIGIDASGQLDVSFNAIGYSLIASPIGGSSRGVETEIQSDGKIVVMGYTTNGANLDIMLLRFNEDGLLDKLFGNEGVTLFPGPGGMDDKGLGLAINHQDEIVVTGFSYSVEGNREIITAKFSKDGFLLSSALYSSGYTDIGFATAIQPDGKILVCGETCVSNDNQALIIIRYNNDLSVDTTFGNNGKIIYDPGWDAKGFGIAMHGNDKIVVCGSCNPEGKNSTLVMQCNQYGVLDPAFGSKGVAVWKSSSLNDDFGNELAVQADGKILIAGNSINDTKSTMYVLRLNDHGDIDNSFGKDGFTTYDNMGFAQAHGIAISPMNGKIIVSGSAKVENFTQCLVLRLNQNGIMDHSFAQSGRYLFDDLKAKNSVANGLAIQSDQKIVITGYLNDGTIDMVLNLRLQ